MDCLTFKLLVLIVFIIQDLLAHETSTVAQIVPRQLRSSAFVHVALVLHLLAAVSDLFGAANMDLPRALPRQQIHARDALVGLHVLRARADLAESVAHVALSVPRGLHLLLFVLRQQHVRQT